MGRFTFIACLFLLVGVTKAQTIDTFTITYIIDGDTFGGINAEGEHRRFRPIGIDCPETGKRNGNPEPFHQEATDFTTSLLKGKKVQVVYDVQPKDHYNRDLVYVYLMDGTFYNKEIMKAGLAQTMSIAPNVRFADLFREEQRQAREQGRGLWKE